MDGTLPQSIIPSTHTPEVLAPFAHARGTKPAGWSFLTGRRAEIESIALE